MFTPMGEPLRKLRDEFQLLEVTDLDDVIKSLPAEQQAKIRWTRPKFVKVIDRVRSEEVTPDMLATSVEDLLAICDAISEVTAGVSTRWIVRDWLEQVPRVSSFLGDQAAADSAEYAMRAIGQLFVTYGADEVVGQAPRMPREKWPAFVRSDAGGLLRAQVLLVAILAERRDDRPPERSRELAHHAMLEAQRGVSAIRRESPGFTPYVNDTEGERRERLLRTVAQLRESMTDDDHAAVFGGDDTPA